MNSEGKNIVIVGSGNVGTQLALLFNGCGVHVTVACRNTTSALHLDEKGVSVVAMNAMPAGADLYLLCLKDSVISDVASLMPDTEGVVAHTSGSLGLEPLSKFNNTGVFYPFQSFRKEIALTVIDFPILIEASNAFTEGVLLQFAATISSSAMVAPAPLRVGIHTAGVFVSNFANLMYGAGWQVAKESRFDADRLLRPLIEETAMRLKYKNPSDLQTGPAIRNDRETILKQLNFLEENPDLYRLYKELTNALLKKYGHEELP